MVANSSAPPFADSIPPDAEYRLVTPAAVRAVVTFEALLP